MGRHTKKPRTLWFSGLWFFKFAGAFLYIRYLPEATSRSLLHACKQQRLWRDCAYAQARLGLCWSPCDKYSFLMCWLICTATYENYLLTCASSKDSDRLRIWSEFARSSVDGQGSKVCSSRQWRLWLYWTHRPLCFSANCAFYHVTLSVRTSLETQLISEPW